MSKIGKMPIKIPDGVEITLGETVVSAKGKNGIVELNQIPGIKVFINESEVSVSLELLDMPNGKAYWGLVRSLLNNAIIGVSQGFSKELELVGVGYRVEKIGDGLRFSVGYSHSVDFKAPEGILLEIGGNNTIKVSGPSKHMVGQTAANIRKIRKPEPYKGKGIKYKSEIIKRKQGKTAKSG